MRAARRKGKTKMRVRCACRCECVFEPPRHFAAVAGCCANFKIVSNVGTRLSHCSGHNQYLPLVFGEIESVCLLHERRETFLESRPLLPEIHDDFFLQPQRGRHRKILKSLEFRFPKGHSNVIFFPDCCDVLSPAASSHVSQLRCVKARIGLKNSQLTR